MLRHTSSSFKKFLPSQFKTSIASAALLLTQVSCGSLSAKNEKKTDEENKESVSGKKDTNTPESVNEGGLKSGQTLIQKVTLKKGIPFQSQFLLAQKMSLAEDADKGNGVEISILEKDGSEKSYNREGLGSTTVEFDPPKDGEYTIAIRNNSINTAEFAVEEQTGAKVVGEIEAAGKDAPHKDIHLKAFVVFSKVCKKTKPDGSSVDSFTAPAGEYFVQPFVFLGKVDAARKVAPLSQASISIVSGDRTVNLKKLSDLELASYREFNSLSKAEHAEYTRLFYQGYFGAAGELYTVDTFRKGGDCEKAVSIPMDLNPGMTKVELVVNDSSVTPALLQKISIRPTVSVPFSMYENNETKLVDYTQCTISRTTAEPKTYNGDAQVCKEFSMKDSPFLKLDYELPSKAGQTGITADSDPTRILFYGHSHPKSWYQKLLDNSSALLSGETKSISLPGCLNNGGLISVPLKKERTELPLAEFNVALGDVVNLARRSGSYTGLVDFYQGNIDGSGELTVPACVPSATESCVGVRNIKVISEKCEIKADSGVAVTALSENMVYPDYFEMSGVVKE
jgi:hypothetical protein